MISVSFTNVCIFSFRVLLRGSISIIYMRTYMDGNAELRHTIIQIHLKLWVLNFSLAGIPDSLMGKMRTYKELIGFIYHSGIRKGRKIAQWFRSHLFKDPDEDFGDIPPNTNVRFGLSCISLLSESNFIYAILFLVPSFPL